MEWLEGNPPIGRNWIAPTVEELQTQPGKWADVRTYFNPNTTTDAMRKLRRKGCEARKELKSGEWHIYARWPK